MKPLNPVHRYATRNAVIKSFADKLTAAVFEGRAPKGFPSDILAAARRKLAIIDAAVVLEDTNTPPGNRLEALKGDRQGQHSIRVNNQWRVCFVWKDDGAHDVEIVDYH
jgi:proteic killer suppression protein